MVSCSSERPRVIASYKVAAMHVSDFLDYLEDGCLILTPRARADIILASLAADVSTAFPRLAYSKATWTLRI